MMMPIDPQPGTYDENGFPLNRFEGNVWLGMLNSLQHLAEWLEQGGDLTPLLRSELIEALRIPAVEKAFREHNTPSDADRRRFERRLREGEVGAWIAVRIAHAARGEQQNILFLARRKFHISEALAEKHLSYFRKQAKLDWDEKEFDTVTLWEKEFDEMCREFDLDPQSARRALNSGKNLGLKF